MAVTSLFGLGSEALTFSTSIRLHYPRDAAAAASGACYMRTWSSGLAGKQCRTVACEVNLALPNPGSLAFHAKRGFIEVGRMLTSDGRHVALLEKDIR